MSDYQECPHPHLCGTGYHRIGSPSALRCTDRIRDEYDDTGVEEVREHITTVLSSHPEVEDDGVMDVFLQEPLVRDYDVLSVRSHTLDGGDAFVICARDTGDIYVGTGYYCSYSYYDGKLGYRMLTFTRCQEKAFHHEKVITAEHAVSEIVDAELTASFREFTTPIRRSQLERSNSFLRRRGEEICTEDTYQVSLSPYGDVDAFVADTDDVIAYHLTPSQHTQLMGMQDPLGIHYPLWDNGQYANSRQWETGYVFYDKKLHRGFLIRGRNRSEWGDTSSDIIDVSGDTLTTIVPDDWFDVVPNDFLMITGTRGIITDTYYEEMK